MARINFTKEHLEKLNQLSVEFLQNATEFKGNVGSTLNVYDLYHTVSLNTITQMHTSVKKQISEISNMDEWSLTDNQQRKQKGLEKKGEFLNLLIGYKRYQQEAENERQRLAELKATYNELRESSKTPEERLKELESQISQMEATI